MSESTYFSTQVIHAGQNPDPSTGAIMQPIYATSTYVQSSPGVHQGFEYSRSQNPTRFALERSLAALEGGSQAFAFSSGLAAISTALEVLDAGSHIVAMDDLYGGTYRLFSKVRARSAGLTFSFVDMTDLNALRDAIRPETRLIWVETPTNPLLKIVDIKKIAQIAREKGVLSCVDNTFATPFAQNPLKLGFDMVVHSTTKYINGHSDVVGGAIVVGENPELREKLQFLQNAIGSVMGPFDAFLTLRGIKTLALRMKEHSASALKIAEFLQQHPRVEKVIYPGLPSHPQHLLAKEQMLGFGGIISLVVKGGLDQARHFLERVRIFALAESLGGVESLIEHPAIMTHASVPKEIRERIGIADGLVRISVGIEDVRDLIHDLDQALSS
jgi:cystathionine gamma-lyase